MNPFTSRKLVPTKTGYGEGLLEAGRNNPRVFVFGADITASTGTDLFAKNLPDRFYSLGIAEQNIAGVAAGFALAGKIPVFCTYAVFSAFRSADQIRVSICYNNLHVIIGGAHAGISVGPDGATHQALEDIAVMQALPGMTVFSPCDATQARLAVMAAIEEIKGPVYLRFGREAVPDFTSPEMPFIPGKGQVFKEGKDVTIISTGHMTWEALEAAAKLETEGISARVINIHTIKPIDRQIIEKAARETGAIVTAEEHQINGGLGSAVSMVLAQTCPVPVEFIAVHDCFGESGTPAELMEKYGLTAQDIYLAVKKVIIKKSIKP
ncbi:MAG: transketolase [Bacteroidetes bacterium HGW-Bacteroidetes-21]|nr:MAG: transketolase [Bacteroidetes bacterium HGW-Bacteroidetes-21]